MQSFAIWVTSQCNMKCSYCYEGQEKEDHSMSQEILEASIAFIENHMKYHQNEEIIVDFHGGEPLLQFEKIKYAIKRLNEIFGTRVRYGITTNGTILTKDILECLVTNFKYSLSISIDGSKETHDEKRRLKNGKGSYDIVIQNAKKILQKCQDVRVRMTVDSTTVDKLYCNVCALAREGFKWIVPGIDYFDPRWNQEKIIVLYEQMLLLKEKQQQGDLTACIGLLDDFQNSKVRKCTGGCDSFHINSHGIIYPCAFVEGDLNYVIGDVFSGINVQKVKEFCGINEIQIEECVGCSHEHACISTRCKILNKILVGDFYKPTPVICNVENLKYSLSK